MTVAIEPMCERELAACPAADEPGFGALATERGNLPLHALSVRATVTGTLARTEVTQGFQNPYDEPLEATYIFPLPDRAAVTAMTLRTRDRTITGVLAERGQARADYQTALAEGRQAALAEEDRPGVFTLGVGNLMPGERATVTLVLDGPLPYADGTLTYRFPLVVAPRYIPGRPLADGTRAGEGYAEDTDAVPDASRITPPVLLPGLPNPVELSIEVDVDPAGLPLREVRSSLHAVHTATQDADRLRIAVEPGERLDRDFVLRLPVADQGAYASSLVVTADPPDAAKLGRDPYGEGTFQLTVLPPADERVLRPRDVVLVIDRSGSMGGWKMVATRRAAARIVDTLTDTDRFAVLSFDDRIETPDGLGAALADATDRNRFRAIEHLASLSARGGTEMLSPLRQAADLLTGREDRSRDAVLVLVTDGQVGNEDQILAGLAGPLGSVRLHTVGVDTAVNAGFLRRLAGLGGGRCELVESEDRLDEAMRAIHRRIATPLVSGLRLDTAGFGPMPGSVVPDRLPDLVAGVPLVLFGRYRTPGDTDHSGPMAVVASGTRAGGEAWRAEVTASIGTPALTAMWARGHLRDLEDRYATSATHAELEEREREIVATSLRFGVLCRFTAFLAEGADVVNPGGSRHRVTQPVESPQGWHAVPLGYRAQAASAPRPQAAQAAPFARTQRGLTDPAESLRPDTALSGTFAPTPAAPAGGPPAAPGAPAPAPAPVGYGVPDDLVTFARKELETLRQAAHADLARRIAVLRELGTGLASLLNRLDAAGAAATGAGALRALAADLVAPIPDGVALESLWMRAFDALELLTAAGPNPPAPESRSRTAFWRR
ncbi:MAG: VIT domain-containing protein [Mycobacteriales bacterium]